VSLAVSTIAFAWLAPLALGGGVPIQFLHHAPEVWPAAQLYVIEGEMQGASEVASAEVLYRTSRTHGWRRLELALVQDALYRAEIPADDLREPMLEYYVVAVDFLEERHPAFASVDSPQEVQIEAPRITVEPVVDPEGSKSTPPQPTPTLRVTRDDTGDTNTAPPTTATPLSEPIELSVLTVARAQIEQLGARTLADVLEWFPAINVTRDLAGVTHVSLNGSLAAGDVLLLVDGVNVSQVLTGDSPWNLPAAILERVEVRRGLAQHPEAPLGRDGVVEVTTVTETTPKLNLTAGSYLSRFSDADAEPYGSYGLALQGGANLAAVTVSGFAALRTSSGTQATVAADAFSSAESRGVPKGPAQDQELQLAAGGAVVLSQHLPGTLTLRLLYFREQRGGNVGLVDTYSPDSSSIWNGEQANLEHAWQTTPTLSLTTRLHVARQQVTQRYQLTPAPFTLSDRDGDGAAERFADGVLEQSSIASLVLGGDSVVHWQPHADHNVRVGIAVTQSDGGDPEVRRNISAVGISQTETAADLGPTTAAARRLDLRLFVADTWQLAPGAQLAGTFVAAHASDLGNAEIAKHVSPRLQLILAPLSWLSYQVALGSTLRLPTLGERSNRQPRGLPVGLTDSRILGNPELDATRRHAIETGLGVRQTLGTARYTANLDVSYALLQDVIVPVPGADSHDPVSGLTELDARKRVDRVGVNLVTQVEFEPAAYLFLHATWQRLTDRAADGTSSYLTSLPQLTGSLGASVPVTRGADAALAISYKSERHNDARTVEEQLQSYRIPPQTWVTLSLRSGWLWEVVRISLTLHNAMDVARQDPVPRPDLVPDLTLRDGRELLITASGVLP